MNLLKIFSLLLILNFNLLAQPTEPKATGNIFLKKDSLNFTIIPIIEFATWDIENQDLNIYLLFYELILEINFFSKKEEYKVLSFNKKFLNQFKKCLNESLEIDLSQNTQIIKFEIRSIYPYFLCSNYEEQQKYKKTFSCMSKYIDEKTKGYKYAKQILFRNSTARYSFYITKNEH